MLTINEQEILVDELQEIEDILFSICQRIGENDELGSAWYMIYKRLQKEKEIEAIMKSEN